MTLKLTYIAGPYSHPDPIANTHNAVKVADELYSTFPDLIVPIVPHLTLLWHLITPHADVNYWYVYDLKVLARCDALLRLPGESTGADDEVDFAQAEGIPVFFSAFDLVQWAQADVHHPKMETQP